MTFNLTRTTSLAFVALASAYAFGAIKPQAIGTVTIAVTSAAASPTPTPTPIPTPTPTPTPSPTVTTSGGGVTVPSPDLRGVASVASGVDVSRNLVASWGTGDVAAQDDPTEGAFRFLCAPSHNAYNDPIVYPGQPGRSHLHTFFGNTGANANSTYASLRTTGEGTCNNLLNRSAYWVPAMMHPSGKVVMPNWISIYYKRAPEGSIHCREPYARACLPLPRGLRYVFGYNMNAPAKSDPNSFRWFNCDGPGAVSGHFDLIRTAARGCPTGAMLGMLLVGPNCWNGTDLDSPDHRSHMAYQYYDGAHASPVCPATHPYLLPFFEVATWYTNDGTAADWTLASDHMPGMADMPGGGTAHADWFGAWEDSIQDLWTANCINKALSCSGGDLGNGKQLSLAQGYTFPNRINLVDPPAR